MLDGAEGCAEHVTYLSIAGSHVVPCEQPRGKVGALELHFSGGRSTLSGQFKRRRATAVPVRRVSSEAASSERYWSTALPLKEPPRSLR